MPDAGGADILIRDGRDDDAPGLVALVARCFADYGGCVLWVDGEVPTLRGVATAYARMDGRFWVAELGGRIVGSVGAKPGIDEVHLLTLYVHPQARRRGLGAQLVGLVEDEARRRRAPSILLWSDTRFADAHRLYERLGYRRLSAPRSLDDLSASREYGFRKELAP